MDWIVARPRQVDALLRGHGLIELLLEFAGGHDDHIQIDVQRVLGDLLHFAQHKLRVLLAGVRAAPVDQVDLGQLFSRRDGLHAAQSQNQRHDQRQHTGQFLHRVILLK